VKIIGIIVGVVIIIGVAILARYGLFASVKSQSKQRDHSNLFTPSILEITRMPGQ